MRPVGLGRAQRADGHEAGRIDRAMVGGDDAGTGELVVVGDVDFKHGLQECSKF